MGHEKNLATSVYQESGKKWKRSQASAKTSNAMQHNFRQKRGNVRQEGFSTLLKVIDCFAHWRKLFNSFFNLFMQQSAQNVLAGEQETEQSFVQQQSHLELFQKPQAKGKKSLV